MHYKSVTSLNKQISIIFLLSILKIFQPKQVFRFILVTLYCVYFTRSLAVMNGSSSNYQTVSNIIIIQNLSIRTSGLFQIQNWTLYSSVFQPFSMEEPLRYIFISRGTPTYENVYRPQKVDSGERKSITARLLSGKLYVKICYIFCIYSTISRGTPDDVLWNPRVPGNPVWETLF
jgi:hypothetical protein